MLFSLLEGENIRDVLIELLLMIPIILFSLSFHEAAHALIADKLGDPTARNLGRLTLNPVKHLDPFGALSMLLIGIGWAKPVPINVRNFENPRKGMMLSALAGPVSNLILAIGFAFLTATYELLLFVWKIEITLLPLIIYQLLYLGVYLNAALAIFNLIPAPPFDGSRIFFYFLPKNWYFRVMQYERYIGLGIMLVLIVLSRLGFSPVGFLAGGLTDLLLWPFQRLAVLIIS